MENTVSHDTDAPVEDKLTKSYDINFNPIQTTDLGLASYEGDLDTVRHRIEAGINWKEEDIHPIHGAVYAGRQDIVEMLLKAGSPVNGQVIYLAYRFSGNSPIFQLLKKEGGATIEESRANLILLDAARAHDLETVTYALSQKANVNATDYFYGFEMWTALHHAAQNFQLDLITLLIEHGASVNARNEKLMTPLRLCARSKLGITRSDRKNCVRYLQLHGGEIGEPISWLSTMQLQHGFPIFLSNI